MKITAFFNALFQIDSRFLSGFTRFDQRGGLAVLITF
jgi:hypothetical protein